MSHINLLSMIPSFDPVEKARLETLLDGAKSHADNVEEQLFKTSISIATETTQYFEKVALGSGATIAAMVSFIGVHSGKLAPPYLLRSALVTLVVTMFAAMYCNWRYRHYVLVNYQEQHSIQRSWNKDAARETCLLQYRQRRCKTESLSMPLNLRSIMTTLKNTYQYASQTFRKSRTESPLKLHG